MAVGNGGEDDDKDRGNGAGAEYAVQGSHVVGVIIWEQELGGDRWHSKIAINIPSSGNEKYYGDDGAAYDNKRVWVSPSVWIAGDLWNVVNK